MPTAALAAAALVGFAANSLLCRAALGPGAVDAATFTAVRIASGAMMLWLLQQTSRPAAARGGSWSAGLLLFAYAAAFSLAYVRLAAGTGALILFGCVQTTMFGAAVVRGERPAPLRWLGLALALGGLVWLTLPGLSAPDPAGAALMAVAGIAWGAYSLRGRGSTQPLAATAGNFLRALPLAAAMLLLAGPHLHASPRGVALAAVSGALASGVGYSLWYAALPRLSATTAALIQLVVPILAAIGGILFLGEPASAGLVVAALCILGGIAIGTR